MAFSYVSSWIPDIVKLNVENCLDLGRTMWASKSKGMAFSYVSSWIPDIVKLNVENCLDLGRTMWASKSKDKQEDSQLKCSEKRKSMSLVGSIVSIRCFVYSYIMWPFQFIEQIEAKKQQLEIEKELLDAHLHRADVVLDSKTAHPRLEVFEKGKCVRDTGFASKVSDCDDRFDSHAFILAAGGFSEGKHYWEVEVGQKEKWDLGVASESAPRKGTITLSPENGYWVMGLDGGKDYLARTEKWTCLQVTGKPTKIGIFLDIPAKSLSFYDVNSRRKLHRYYTICSCGKFYPFFSTGFVTSELDGQPLKITIFERGKERLW
ncbi:butyrophilin subfamily 3 member A1-like isoform X2 [Rhineura floridana]|uniref:butyrophilin subfamily 3 member A1-like isoform X2 n=1 Tax=Rhineura floridana TaxID=261503 RepID=UPI002AC80172|nr:butyrophilin subfamily 3 member A1-like isoform X2 [Rhineura floridana]